MIGLRYVSASMFGDHTGGTGAGRAQEAPSDNAPTNARSKRDLMTRGAEVVLALVLLRGQFVRARDNAQPSAPRPRPSVCCARSIRSTSPELLDPPRATSIARSR